MKKNILIFAVSATAFAAIFAVSLLIPNRKYEFFGKEDRLDILVMGDSIMDNTLDGNNICALLNNYIEADVKNCAIGGTTACSINKNNEIDYCFDKLNFYNLADVAVTGNLTTVFDDSYLLDNTVSDAIIKTKYLAYTDLGNCDFLIVQYGMNDSTMKIPASSDDKYDQATFGGVMRKGIEQIHERYPDLPIVLNTVTYAHIEYNVRDKHVIYDTKANGLMDAYNAELRSIAEENDNVYLFDVKEYLDINETNYTEYLMDGIHLNFEAKKLFAESLAEYLRELK